MISGKVEGAAQVTARFEQRSDALMRELKKGVSRLTIKLQRKVQTEKLSGQVLGVRTGRGRRSIHQEVVADGDTVTGIVSTNVFYMIGWETGWQGAGGGQIAKAKARFSPKASAANFKTGGARKRAFLVPSLEEFDSSGEVTSEMAKVAERAMQ